MDKDIRQGTLALDERRALSIPRPPHFWCFNRCFFEVSGYIHRDHDIRTQITCDADGYWLRFISVVIFHAENSHRCKLARCCA